MLKIYTISALTENSPGVLHRITAIFTRRKINIESLCVSETTKEGISRFTIGIKTTEEEVSKIVAQIAKIIEVVEVYANTDEELIYKEVAFFKVTIGKSESKSSGFQQEKLSVTEEKVQRDGAHNDVSQSIAITQNHAKMLIEVEAVANRYGASIAYASSDSIIIEKIGRESDIDSLYMLLEQFGVTEFVRSGRIALQK
jgi:acetolactate synthase I/III small subunit